MYAGFGFQVLKKAGNICLIIISLDVDAFEYFPKTFKVDVIVEKREL